jgi:hypothetical protein
MKNQGQLEIMEEVIDVHPFEHAWIENMRISMRKTNDWTVPSCGVIVMRTCRHARQKPQTVARHQTRCPRYCASRLSRLSARDLRQSRVQCVELSTS